MLSLKSKWRFGIFLNSIIFVFTLIKLSSLNINNFSLLYTLILLMFYRFTSLIISLPFILLSLYVSVFLFFSLLSNISSYKLIFFILILILSTSQLLYPNLSLLSFIIAIWIIIQLNISIFFLFSIYLWIFQNNALLNLYWLVLSLGFDIFDTYRLTNNNSVVVVLLKDNFLEMVLYLSLFVLFLLEIDLLLLELFLLLVFL